MKVFVSSTCHDLVDLRAELYEELRELGAEPHFSDRPDSAFSIGGEPGTDSIEVCLANLRACEVIVFVLSQRYGGLLGDRYHNLSATHCEYREARKEKKRILFYVRDRLEAEYGVWKRNDPKTLTTAWVKKTDYPLFEFLEEHRNLEQDAAGPSNNWLIPFRSSVDLRADIRKRLATQLTETIARRLIESGQVPILIATANQLHRYQTQSNFYHRFTFEIANAGPIPAIQVETRIASYAPGNMSQVAFSTQSDTPVSCILSGQERGVFSDSSVELMIETSRITRLLTRPNTNECFQWKLLLDAMTPSGYVFRDHYRLNLCWNGTELSYQEPPVYIGKSLVMAGDLFIRESSSA